MKSILKTSSVLLLPSEKLLEHIKLLQRNDEQRTPHVNNSLITEEDCKFLKSLELDDVEFTLSNDIPTEDENNASSKDITTEEEKQCLNSGDVLRLFERLQKENNNNTNKIYLHELLLGSAIILPKNLEIPRNEELDMRCSLLKVQQENREYKAITKNIDNVRKPHPEDTIAYQIKQINKQLIAILQFIITVLAGFLFGFHGIELMIGTLDFGFRLLLGVICSLVIALAELYFLAKTLNENFQYEAHIKTKMGHSSLD